MPSLVLSFVRIRAFLPIPIYLWLILRLGCGRALFRIFSSRSSLSLRLSSNFWTIGSSSHWRDISQQVVAVITHKLSSKDNTFTIGCSYALDIFTIVKGRVNNYGTLAALVQHEWRPKLTFILSAEIDSKALDKQTKFGLALALKP